MRKLTCRKCIDYYGSRKLHRTFTLRRVQTVARRCAKAFKALINNDKEEYDNSEWTAFSTPSLAEIWDAPEEDYWDELYAKQRAND